MGSYGGGDRRIFTGLDPAQPVELFISLIEQEGSVMDHDPGWRCEEALRRIDRGNTPAGIWYSSGAGGQAEGEGKKWTLWEDLKSDLIEAFGGLFRGCTDQTYSMVECLEFLQSLIKPDEEPFTTFLFRVQWVLKNVVKASEPNRWTPLIFLMGLKEVDQKFVFSLMKETWSCSGLTLADDSDTVDFMHVLKVVDKDNADQAVKQEICQDQTLEGLFELTRRASRALDSPRALLRELQRYKDTVSCGAPGAEIPGHLQEQLTQTLIDVLIKEETEPVLQPEPEDADLLAADIEDLAKCKDNEGDEEQVSEAVPGEVKLEGENQVMHLSEAVKRGSEEGTVGLTVPESKRRRVIPLTCPYCGLSQNGTREALIGHMRSAHNYGQTVFCKGCQTVVRLGETSEERARAWDQHEKDHHLPVCSICQGEFDDIRSMRLHHQTSHAKKQLRCELCQGLIRYRDFTHNCCETTRNKANKEREVFRIYRMKKGEVLEQVRSVSTRIRAPKNQGTKWYCGICSNDFPKLNDLTDHIKSDHEACFYQCDQCGDYKAKTLGGVATHKYRKHGELTPTFEKLECEVPGCKFYTFNRGMLYHHNRQLHDAATAEETSCKICGVRKQSARRLREHVERTHMKIKLHACKLCDASYASDQGLKVHIEAKHSGTPRPKSLCTQCGATFSTKYVLKAHVLEKHSDFKQTHRCKTCGEEFSSAAYLSNHVMTSHKPDEMIPCPRCDQKFIKAHHLREHVLTKHLKVVIKQLQCATCGSEYKRGKDCWAHIATKHLNWSSDRAKCEWKALAKEKPHLIVRKDWLKEECEALRGVIDDKYIDRTRPQNFYTSDHTQSVAVETNLATVVHNFVTSDHSLKASDMGLTSL